MGALDLLRKSLSNPAWVKSAIQAKHAVASPEEAKALERFGAKMNEQMDRRVGGGLTPEQAFVLQRNINKYNIPEGSLPPEQLKFENFAEGGSVLDEPSWGTKASNIGQFVVSGIGEMLKDPTTYIPVGGGPLGKLGLLAQGLGSAGDAEAAARWLNLRKGLSSTLADNEMHNTSMEKHFPNIGTSVEEAEKDLSHLATVRSNADRGSMDYNAFGKIDLPTLRTLQSMHVSEPGIGKVSIGDASRNWSSIPEAEFLAMKSMKHLKPYKKAKGGLARCSCGNT